MDAGEFALELGSLLEATEFVRVQGWTVDALDIGEVEIGTPDGRFLLTIERVGERG